MSKSMLMVMTSHELMGDTGKKTGMSRNHDQISQIIPAQEQVLVPMPPQVCRQH